MKPMLCDSCLDCEKEIKHTTEGYYNRGTTKLYIFCKKKGRYITSREKYNCSWFSNKKLTDYTK